MSPVGNQLLGPLEQAFELFFTPVVGHMLLGSMYHMT